MSREEETEALFQAICESNKEDELLLPDFTAQRIEPKIPYVSIEYIDEEDDDVEVHPSLQERFKLRVNEPVPQPAPAPQPAPLPHQTSTQPSMNQQVILVRTEDSNRNQIQSQNAQARWALFFVCGDVSNLTPVTANNVSVPAFTSSFKNILQNPHASIRQDAMTDLITSVADQWAEEKGTTADITVVPDTFSKAILSGCVSQNPLSQRLRSTNSSKELTILSFGPQTNNPEKIQQIKDYKEKINAEQLNDVPDSQRTQVDTDIPSFGNISEVHDTRITMDNFQMVSSAIVEMPGTRSANQLNRNPIFLQLLQNLDDYLLSRRVIAWLREYGQNMRWLPSTITVLLQNVFCAFAKLSKSFIPVQALTSDLTDVTIRGSISTNDIYAINGAIAAVKHFRSAIDTAIGSNAALSEQIHCPQIERDAIAIFDPDIARRKRPVSASAPEGRSDSGGRGGPSNQSIRTSSTHRSNRLQQRNNIRTRKQPLELGMFYLNNTNMSNNDVFPNDATCAFKGQVKKLCPDFTCVGKECPNGFDCEFAHVTNYSRLSQQVFDSICSHFHSRSIGWLSAGMLEKQSKVTLSHRFTSLKGDANGKFDTQG